MANGFDSDMAVGFCETCPGAPPPSCRAMENKIRDECGITNRQNTEFRDGRDRMHRRTSGTNRRSNRRGDGTQIRNMTWKDRHCGSALFNPNMSQDALMGRMQELETSAQEFKEDLLDLLDDLPGDIAREAAQTYATRAVARTGAGLIFGPAGATVATVANIASGLWSAWSAYSSVSAQSEMIQRQLAQLHEMQGRAAEVLDAIDDPARMQELREEMVGEMVEAIAENDCLKARRCFLVPFDNPERQLPGYNRGRTGSNKTGGDPTMFDRAPFNLSDSRGCCPGQTGHHLLPDAWFKNQGDQRGAGSRCTGDYNINRAPVACLEGYNGTTGTHGEAHTSLNEIVEGLDSGDMSMNEAIDIATEAYAGPGGTASHCNDECIRDQLRGYYGSLGCSPSATTRSAPAAPAANEGAGNNEFTS